MQKIIFDQSNISERNAHLSLPIGADGTNQPSSQFVSAMSMIGNLEGHN